MATETRIKGVWGKLSMLLPLLLTAILYLASTTGRAVIDYDEGYYAQPAQRMAEYGDWVTPYANGVRFLEKPPLLYWITALSFKIFGINEFALRLPTALAVIALVWLVMLMARRAFDASAALIAGSVCRVTSSQLLGTVICGMIPVASQSWSGWLRGWKFSLAIQAREPSSKS